MTSLTTITGLVAAFCTTVSYIPQVRKCWKTHSTGDLSLKMIVLLATGIALWIVYGVMKTDGVIITANAVSLLLLANLLFFKIKEMWSGDKGSSAEQGEAAPAE